MVLGYHVIMGMYGFWLPNDPRGSGSDVVRQRKLRSFGPATKVTTRHSRAHDPHDRALRLAAKRVLARPPVKLTGVQARAIGTGFELYIKRQELRVWACSILPEHTHLVIGRSGVKCEEVAKRLKEAATKQLVEEGLHPFQDQRLNSGRLPPVFGQDQWIVYLDTIVGIHIRIGYVEENPEKEGKPRQRWPFVVPFVE